MTSLDIAALVNLLGWTLGLALYALLFALSLRSFGVAKSGADGRGLFSRLRFAVAPVHGVSGSPDVLPFLTALLGLVWNAGALVTHGLHGFGGEELESTRLAIVGAVSVAALGFLPAVVVHSAIHNMHREAGARGRWMIVAAYALSSCAAIMHCARALFAGSPSSESALYLLTGGFLLLMGGLLLLTRGEAGAKRAVWATALAIFAVSALHLSSEVSHDGGGRWYTELVGHHASLPLALAILYQDYRFAFADIFLKRALAFVALIATIALSLTIFASIFVSGLDVGATPVGEFVNTRSIGVLLALWAATALLFPWLRSRTAWFVDAVVLRRADYERLRAEVARLAQTHESPARLLDDVVSRLRPALTADAVVWRSINTGIDEIQGVSIAAPRPPKHERRNGARVVVPTTEAPHYEIEIGELAGGRRLLSDDVEMLDSVALTLARRIDSLRVTHERCEQAQREQEIATLASEAQLRALRAQVNPHFLFNALTTIGYLIQTSPGQALSTLLRLTDLLRRVLRSASEWTTLDEELRLVEAYLDIERARFEERLRVRIDIPEELRQLMVPSLVIQPLVENAIKHGITPQRAGGEISLTAQLKSDDSDDDATFDDSAPMLSIVVADTGAGTSAGRLAHGRETGVGLGNVEQRLRLCCDGAGRLFFESEPGRGARVELLMPAKSAHRQPRTHVPPPHAVISRPGADNASVPHGDATTIITSDDDTAPIRSSQKERRIG